MKPKSQILIDPNKNLKQWVMFPDSLESALFKGYETRDDITQNRGAFPIGQNVTFGNNNIPTLRKGYAVIGTEQSNATPVKRSWVYETRDGVIYELKAFSTGIYFWLKGVSIEYELLKGGFTSGLEFGYGNIGDSDDVIAYSYFCNGADEWYRFSGAYGLYASDNSSNQITVSGSVTLANLGFTATGTIIINGEEITYTGLSGQSFTGCSAVPTTPTVGDIIVQSPEVVSAMSSQKGQVVMAHDGRLHARNESKKSVWLYSKLDDPDDWATGATDGLGGAKEVEFGGPITAFSKLNKTAVCFKKRLIKILDFVQSGTRIDVPRYATLMPADDKGTTLGSTNQKSTFATPLGIIFITPDKKMALLSGITENQEPQYITLSDPMQEVFSKGIHDEGCGICFENEVWYAFKQDEDSTFNDIVVRGNLERRSITKEGKIIPIQWDTPYIGWYVNDWTIVYDSDDGKNELHWHSSINSNTYEVISEKSDNTNAFTATLRTWAEDFGLPYHTKKADLVYIEISMNENTEITAAILYDENGITSQEEYTLRGTDTANKFDDTEYNPYGASEYGRRKIGSNPEPEDKPKYRYALELKPNVEFFNISLQLSTNGEAQDFDLIRFGYRIIEVKTEFERKYKKVIS